MSTDKSISTEEEVLLAFSVEEQHDHLMLERYIKKYPQYTTALVDCSIEFLLDSKYSELDEEHLSNAAVDRAWKQFEASTPCGTTGKFFVNPFAQLSSIAFREIAKTLNVNSLFLGRVRDRTIISATYPLRFVQKIACELGTSVDSMLEYLASPPTIVSSQSFRSSVKPTVSEQISFDHAVEISQLTRTQEEALAALRD
jgi:hypothetical protein